MDWAGEIEHSGEFEERRKRRRRADQAEPAKRITAEYATPALRARWVLLLVGLVIGFIGGASSIIYLQMSGAKDTGEMSIVFAPKNYYDTEQMVAVSGTLTGPGMAYPNNTYSIACYQEMKECWMTYVDAIGAQQIGRMDAPSAYDIRSWTRNEVVAGYDAPYGCFKTTITIARSTKEVLWVKEPVNQTKPFCKDAKNEIRKFSIKDSPGSNRTLGRRQHANGTSCPLKHSKLLVAEVGHQHQSRRVRDRKRQPCR